MKKQLAILLASFALVALTLRSTAQETLLIGPGDQLHIQVLDTPEMDQHPRVTDAGDVPVLGIGSVKVRGLTPAAAADQIQKDLVAAHYMNHPTVTITVDQYATQTISVLGQVKAPGAYSVTTARSVLDAIALAGGLTEAADRHVTVQHRSAPDRPVTYDMSNDNDVAFKNQVEVYPGDIVLVARAGIAYVLGDVSRPGGIVMQNNRSQLTLLQAVALAGGTHTSAVPSHARLMRRTPDGGFTEMAVNFSKVQKGESPDMLLKPDDVVYIPFSYIRNIGSSSAGIVASAASASIYALP